MRSLLLFLPACLLAQSPFELRPVGETSIEVLENGRPAIVYNYGTMSRPGVPADRSRCCYAHPVYTPSGVMVTDDFPADHYHHRGLFWAWPIVESGGARHDLWTLRGIRHEFIRWIERGVAPASAFLAVENGWFIGSRQVIRETVRMVVNPASGGSRRIDFTLALEAADGPVTLRGEPAQKKGYGGFSARFAPRKETVIKTPAGVESRDTDMVSHAWATFEGLFEGGRAALRIDQIDPPAGTPDGWCLRHYGFLGVNHPGLASLVLEPGKPLTLRYAVTVSDVTTPTAPVKAQ